MSQLIALVNKHDRPQKRFKFYTEKSIYNNGKKVGASYEVGIHQVKREWSIFQAEAKGPNASVQTEASLLGAWLEAQAGLGCATMSVKPGPFKADLNMQINTGSIADIIDNYDRPGHAYAKGLYANTDKYAHALTNKPGQRVPKAVVMAQAGVGIARAEWSVFEAEAKGPNASAAAQANVLGVGAMARAEVGSASASAGPVKVTVGLAVDTGAKVGADGVEAKILGTGFKAGANGVGASVLGNEVNCAIM